MNFSLTTMGCSQFCGITYCSGGLKSLLSIYYKFLFSSICYKLIMLLTFKFLVCLQSILGLMHMHAHV
jgi:hypothetical protein